MANPNPWRGSQWLSEPQLTQQSIQLIRLIISISCKLIRGQITIAIIWQKTSFKTERCRRHSSSSLCKKHRAESNALSGAPRHTTWRRLRMVSVLPQSSNMLWCEAPVRCFFCCFQRIWSNKGSRWFGASEQNMFGRGPVLDGLGDDSPVLLVSFMLLRAV